MKHFKFIALAAMLAIILSVIAIFWYEIETIIKEGINPTSVKWNYWRFPEFFGVMCYAVEGVGAVLPVRSTMKQRKHYRPMFLSTMIIIGFLYVSFGIVGCLCFGKSTMDIIF